MQLVFICVRTLWHSVPFLTGGAPPPAARRLLPAASSPSSKSKSCAPLIGVSAAPPFLLLPAGAAEERLTQSTEYIFYAGAALFGLRAWAFGFGKAQRERLWAIMLYSIAGLALLAEVRLRLRNGPATPAGGSTRGALCAPADSTWS